MSKDDDQDVELESPAMKKFNAPKEYVKHVTKTGFAGAVKGALIGAGLALAYGVIAGGAIAFSIPFIGPLLLPFATSLGLSATATMATSWALQGALLGGAIGAVSGAMDAEEVVAEKKEQLQLRIEAKEARVAKMDYVKQQMATRNGQAFGRNEEMASPGLGGMGRLQKNDRGVSAT